MGLPAARFYQLQLIIYRKLLGCWMNSEDAIKAYKAVVGWIVNGSCHFHNQFQRLTPYLRATVWSSAAEIAD